MKNINNEVIISQSDFDYLKQAELNLATEVNSKTVYVNLDLRFFDLQVEHLRYEKRVLIGANLRFSDYNKRLTTDMDNALYELKSKYDDINNFNKEVKRFIEDIAATKKPIEPDFESNKKAFKKGWNRGFIVGVLLSSFLIITYFLS